jgi:hypothetical protein
MTHTHHDTGRNRIPALGEDQPPPKVIDGYWRAVDLTDHGWHLKRLAFDVDTVTAFVTALSPTRRVVTVSWDLRGHRIGRQQVPGRAASYLLKLAQDVAYLGTHDAETGEDLLGQLCWLVQGREQGTRHHRGWRRTSILPTVSALEQPQTRARVAAWLIARLVAKYRWQVRHLGEDIAGGGFIAEIPGDVLAVYPATMDDDGTAAASLARLMPKLNHRDLAVLRNLDYRALWAAGSVAGAGQ